ncbi:putative lipoprotein [Candidatus Rhodobacter oscarellae]|uniref:Putative lipoprotein n=1 Tax=Candidatus Rhodobacter oscarellae TaxID=1675527 RepID=A0A0J9GYJ2_9RHOB|nr:hypothetical protein [Candidatus Rhodobacter lobularis]KMW58553.1 putative lipoprotein [Candidatus Rhodobacter lobularis]
MRQLILVLCFPFLLAACGAEPVWAPEEEVQRAIYRHDAPPSITVITVVSNRDGSGGHSALLINGSQRLIFDPAGTWHHPHIPERNDVHFGMKNAAVDFYLDYHARETWHVVSQEIPVSAEVAERALALVKGYGAVSKAYCTRANTDILAQLEGFEGVPRTFYPVKLMNFIDTIPGVKRSTFYDDSPANNGTIKAPALL